MESAMLTVRYAGGWATLSALDCAKRCHPYSQSAKGYMKRAWREGDISLWQLLRYLLTRA